MQVANQGQDQLNMPSFLKMCINNLGANFEDRLAPLIRHNLLEVVFVCQRVASKAGKLGDRGRGDVISTLPGLAWPMLIFWIMRPDAAHINVHMRRQVVLFAQMSNHHVLARLVSWVRVEKS